MMKRLLSLVLCLAMLAGTLLMVGCGETTTTSSDETLPATINMLLIADSVTPEAAQNVEDAINKLTKSRFKTKVEMTFVTADKYLELVEQRVAEADHNAKELAAINKYNSLAQKKANAAEKLLASEKKNTSKWTQKVSSVVASTLSTGEVYSAEETTVYEDGKIETLYPEATSPIDIIMIADREMYDYLDGNDYLLSIANKLTTDFPRFKQYIYPTFFDHLQTVTGDIKAIPNNNVLAEYTYLAVDKELADKYDLDVDMIDNYSELSDFLAQVKANESVAPMATEPEALGIATYYDNGIAVGTYFDPIYGYNAAEGTNFTIKNLFEIPEYKAHLALMQDYQAKGYITEGAEDFAVTVLKGDASVTEEYADDYYLKVLQNPFVETNEVFNGMFAVSSFTSDEKRALQVIELFTIDSEAKNLLQYGIEYDGDNGDVANYKVNEIEKEDGSVAYSIQRLNQNYMMNNAYTGNVYMGYPEEGQSIDAWTYYKQTNLDSNLAPFGLFYVDDEALDEMLDDILRRAVLTETLAAVGIDYDEYESTVGTNAGNNLRINFKKHYISYFMEFLADEGVSETQFNVATKGTPTGATADFVNFLNSAEGQAVLKKVGFVAVNEDAPAYVPANVSGTVKLSAFTANTGATMLRVPYMDTFLAEVVSAYKQVQPNVTLELPKKDKDQTYSATVSDVIGGKADVWLVTRELNANEAKSVNSTLIATDLFTVFDSFGHLTYGIEWYENKMIEDYTNNKYGGVISAEALAELVAEKLASLAGAKASKNNTASVVYQNAKKSAADYYTNIEYLRIMAEILLWDELPANELDAYRALSDTDFENAVFNYVRANYETENNLTEEDYVKLVQDFMASVLEYSAADRTTYTISWDEFQETKEKALVYLSAAETVKAAYQSKLEATVGKGMLSLLTYSEIMDEVYNIMYTEYLAENGLDKVTFENSVKDMYLNEVGTTAEAFAEYTKTSDEYKNYLSQLKKEYKDLLIEVYGKDAYKAEDGIKNDDILATLFDYYLEETTKLNDKLASLAGVSYDELAEAEVHMNNYEMYIGTLKTKFVYTLRTKYTSTQINNWTLQEAETNIYNILYDTGFYTNEMAKYIGLELSAYMLAKSNAVTYQSYLSKLTTTLSAELKALGYDAATFAKADGDLVEEVCSEIILEKYFSDKISIEEKLIDSCGTYVADIAKADDVVSYVETVAAELSSDYFFNAVVNTLQASWAEQRTAMEGEG